MALVVVESVWKKFMLHKDRAESVGQILRQMMPGRPQIKPEAFWALRDVSLSMQRGDSLGIVGNNGSGKSTLLKLITRTMNPTSGNIRVGGRLSALIELGAGFHPDFTGRENVILNASILGVGRREIQQRMEEIIEFADIRPFVDVPVKYYSSGMHARLGFAVAINVDPEILIVDEVLAVGDEAFQQKCMDRIFAMKRKGISILLVTHDLSAVERLMDRAIWLNGGSVAYDGLPRDAIRAYRIQVSGATVGAEGATESPIGQEWTAQLNAVHVSARSGGAIFAGDPVDIVCQWKCETSVRCSLNISVRRPDGLVVAEVSSQQDAVPLELPQGSSQVTVSIDQVMLTTGRYEVDITLVGEGGGSSHQWPKAAEFSVQNLWHTQGVVILPHSWRVG